MLGYLFGIWEEKDFSTLFSLLLGGTAMFAMFTLTWFAERYYLQLLPVALLFLVNMDKSKILLSPFIRVNDSILKNILLKKTLEFNPFIFKQIMIIIISIIIIIKAIFFVSHFFQYGIETHIKAIYQGKGWLNGATENNKIIGSFIDQSYPKLVSNINQNFEIFTTEPHWFKSFTDVHLDNVYSQHILPCFKEDTFNSGEFFESLDRIFINNKTEKYEIHVAPFLKKALNENWLVEEVEHYGKIYKKLK